MNILLAYISIVLTGIMFLLYRIVSILLLPKDEDTSGKKFRYDIENFRKILGVEQKKKGAIFIPPSDVEMARQEIIERNAAMGRETRISELYENDPEEPNI